MFRSSQIVSATSLVKRFGEISRHLRCHPQALLITQRSGDYLVLVNAEIFEEMTLSRLKTDGVEVEEAPEPMT